MLVILLGFYASTIQAKLIEYIYDGGPVRPGFAETNLHIDFQIEDSLISNGGFKITYETNYDQKSPFHSFVISSGSTLIDDSPLSESNSYYYKNIYVKFGTDPFNGRLTWDVTASAGFAHVGGHDTTLQSGYLGSSSLDSITYSDCHFDDCYNETYQHLLGNGVGGGGGWKIVQVGNVPLPGALLFFISGLMAIGCQRKRANA